MELITDLTKPIPVKYNYTSTALKNFMLCGFKLKNKKFNRKQEKQRKIQFQHQKIVPEFNKQKKRERFRSATTVKQSCKLN